MAAATATTTTDTPNSSSTDRKTEKSDDYITMTEKGKSYSYVPYGLGMLIGLASFGVAVWAGSLLLSVQTDTNANGTSDYYGAGVALIVLATLALVIVGFAFMWLYSDLSRLKKCEAYLKTKYNDTYRGSKATTTTTK